MNLIRHPRIALACCLLCVCACSKTESEVASAPREAPQDAPQYAPAAAAESAVEESTQIPSVATPAAESPEAVSKKSPEVDAEAPVGGRLSAGSQASAADLDFGNLPSPDTKPESSPSGNASGVLKESHEVIERYDDESVKRWWYVRLYVNFDRSRPWHEQPRGSWEEHGPYEEYYPGGKQKMVAGNFAAGARDGKWTFWHAGGQKAKEGAYADAKLEGPWRYYRADGTLSRIEHYANHQKHGTWQYFAADGKTVVREETYDRDEPR